MEITFNKQQLIAFITEVTGEQPDELRVLDAMYRLYKGDADVLMEEKVRLLVGQEVEQFVAGVSVEGRQDIIKKVSVGDFVTFCHQPDNPHDTNAVGVFWKNEQIGFLPKEKAALVKDIANKVVGKVVRVGRSLGSPYWGVSFIYLRAIEKPEKSIIYINYDAIKAALDLLTPQQLAEERMAAKEIMSRINKNQIARLKKAKTKTTSGIQPGTDESTSVGVSSQATPPSGSAAVMPSRGGAIQEQEESTSSQNSVLAVSPTAEKSESNSELVESTSNTEEEKLF